MCKQKLSDITFNVCNIFSYFVYFLFFSGVNQDLLKLDTYIMDPNKDALFRGEFEVVKELTSTLKNGIAAKNVCDKVVDKNGTKKTGGTGMDRDRMDMTLL